MKEILRNLNEYFNIFLNDNYTRQKSKQTRFLLYNNNYINWLEQYFHLY